MSNTRIWDALSKTDPKHTKPFSRSGGFKGTAIKPIWLTKRLTEHFGPAGTGWGMDEPTFQTVAAGDEILVFCTVALWYRESGDDTKRGTIYGVGGDKVLGKNKYGPFTNDEAFKASYTDALSNAMKQIGMGADIHMGQFEDEKYVRETAREFANGNIPQVDNPLPEEDRHLLKNGETRSTYQVATADKSPGRTAAEFWASQAVTLFSQKGYSLLEYKEWKVTPCTNKGTKTNEQKLAELREKHSDLADKIDEAVSNIAAVAA
jgi:hypothetical protein